MDNYFIEGMKSKSNDELLVYVDNYKSYQIDAFNAAVLELRNRDVILPDDKIEAIRKDLTEIDKKRMSDSDEVIYKWDKNITDDKSAPLLFSEKSIFMFSVIFSTIFGSILLSLNLIKLKKIRYCITVLIFGLIFSSLTLILVNRFELNSLILFVINGMGSLILHYLFWFKFIGKEFKYRSQSIIIPLIFSILVAAAAFYSLVM